MALADSIDPCMFALGASLAGGTASVSFEHNDVSCVLVHRIIVRNRDGMKDSERESPANEHEGQGSTAASVFSFSGLRNL